MKYKAYDEKKKKKKKRFANAYFYTAFKRRNRHAIPVMSIFLTRRCQMHINSINFVICLHEKTKQTNKKKDKKQKTKGNKFVL